MRRAAFLDRDGTINEEVGYLRDPQSVVLIPGSGEAIRLLNEAGVAVIVVTNQSGVARGLFTIDAVRRSHDRLRALLAGEGARIDAFYVCPHHPDFTGSCTCRKPGEALFVKAIRDWRLTRTGSVAIGDRYQDLAPGMALGLRTALVRTGYGETSVAELSTSTLQAPDVICGDLLEAVRWFLA